MKKYFCLISTALALFSSTLLFAAPPHYAVIVDAGSTGSRLHLFQYSKTAQQKIPSIQDIFSEQSKPGLSSFANNPEAAGESLKPLLDHVTQELQKNHLDPHGVPISVLATAGMRLLPESTQLAIYQSVSNYLSEHYSFTLGEIKTIPGKMEGIYGWLDINYLLKSFESSQDITKGSIDMGGASTQIVFSTDFSPTAASNPDEEVTLQIGGNRYLIFSKSFLGLGLLQALSAMNSYALASTCYPANYPLSPTVQGRFNFSSCGSVYTDLINKQEVAQQVGPLPASDFIAYSGIYHTYHFFGVNNTTQQTTVEAQIQSVCGKTWEQLMQEHPKVPAIYLSFCANGVYLSALLYDTYQIPGKNLVVANQINQQEIDWTLGALLYQLVTASGLEKRVT